MLLQTFKKAPLFLIAGTVLMFTSCKGEANNTIQDSPVSKETINSVPSFQSETKDKPVQSPEIKNNESEVKSKSDTEEVRLNPPHGQPGHDCAVPVGDPLPSPGSATNTGVPANNPGTAPIPNSSTPQVNPAINQSGATAKLNPPHGQPGHDCSVPVGQPLN